MTFFGRPKTAAIGSSRWWTRALTDVGLRLAALILVVLAMVTGRASGVEFWIGFAAVIIMALLLVFPVMACVMALRDPARHMRRDEDGEVA